MFGTVTDNAGKPVTAILELQPTTRGGQIMDMNVNASAYGKDGVKNLVENSGVVYLDPDKKRTRSWLQGLGLQLPSDTTAFGSIGRISYPDGKVKIDSVPYLQYMKNGGDNSTRSQRRENLTDRAVLERVDEIAGAVSDSGTVTGNTHGLGVDEVTSFKDKLTAGERYLLNIYAERLAKLNDLQEQRREQGRLYRRFMADKNPNNRDKPLSIDYWLRCSCVIIFDKKEACLTLPMQNAPAHTLKAGASQTSKGAPAKKFRATLPLRYQTGLPRRKNTTFWLACQS